jgi:hypothetical protein
LAKDFLRRLPMMLSRPLRMTGSSDLPLYLRVLTVDMRNSWVLTSSVSSVKPFGVFYDVTPPWEVLPLFPN